MDGPAIECGLADEFAAAVAVYDEQDDRPEIRKREELMRRKNCCV
jgi:hypothetical protein